MSDARSDNKKELQIVVKPQKAHRMQVMPEIVKTKNMDNVKPDFDKSNEELAGGLHEPAGATEDYEADPIVCHIGIGRNVICVVRWNGCTQANNTI